MTDARTTRIGEIVHHRQNDADNASRTTRVGEIAHHRIDPTTIFARTTRVGVIVMIRKEAPGWDIVKRERMPELAP